MRNVLFIDDANLLKILPRDDVTADKVKVVEPVADEVVVVVAQADVVKPIRDSF